MQTAKFDPNMLRRHDVNGPRYTSYPTADQFHESDFRRAYAKALAELPDDAPLSLYVHVPFCTTICYYCACNKINTGNHKHADEYIERLIAEMAMQAALAPPDHTVEQLHFGGGTPTFLNDVQMARVFAALHDRFNLTTDPRRDYGIEIDPRNLPPRRIEELARLGFNRMSIGIQDFDPAVQEAVNRIQSEEETRSIVEAARANGFGSISFDLIYGLPRQTPHGFRRTLERAVRLDPDRLSIYSYAHLPQRFKTQRQIKSGELPTAATKLELLESAINFLTDAGYEYVGMDHFAKPTDTLIAAQNDKRMHRNFQGYTTHGHCSLIGLGVSSIATVGSIYCQNAKSLGNYYAAIDAGRLAIERGFVLNDDDLMTRDVIQSLMCSFEFDLDVFSERYGIDFREYFELEWVVLEEMAEQGLVKLSPNRIKVTSAGRFLIRNVCMVFDAYLSPQATGFSKAI